MIQTQSQDGQSQSQSQSRPADRSILLGRTAAGLFWMFRYVERAETLARVLEAGQRLALTRRTGEAESEWRAILVAAGQEEAFAATGRTPDARTVPSYLLHDPAAGTPVSEMIALARTNARAVRTALTREVWEAVNDFHLWASTNPGAGVAPEALPDTLAQIRQHGAAIRGAFASTMLRNEIYDFARLGTFVERLDGTARLLDVKYHVLLPRAQDVGGELDAVQWEQMLRAQQVNRAFMMVHGDDYGAAAVADFLILDVRNPRSLAHASDRIRKHLDYLARSHEGPTPAHATAEALDARLAGRTVEPILEAGLHEFLTGIVADAYRLADQIAQSYRFHA